MNKQHQTFNWQWALGALAISLGSLGTIEPLPAEARSNPFDDRVEPIQTDLSRNTDSLIARHHPRHRQHRQHRNIRFQNLNRHRGFGLRFGRQHRPRFNRHHRIHRNRNHQRGGFIRNSGFYIRHGGYRQRRF